MSIPNPIPTLQHPIPQRPAPMPHWEDFVIDEESLELRNPTPISPSRLVGIPLTPIPDIAQLGHLRKIHDAEVEFRRMDRFRKWQNWICVIALVIWLISIAGCIIFFVVYRLTHKE